MERHDWVQVRKTCHQLLKQGLERICNLVQKNPLYPLDSNLYQTMGIAPLPNTTDISKLKRRLYDEFHVEVPLIDWNGQKFVRISIQAYNSEEDLDALIVGLRTLLPAVS
jgi:isopenicillin-N epimerase